MMALQYVDRGPRIGTTADAMFARTSVCVFPRRNERLVPVWTARQASTFRDYFRRSYAGPGLASPRKPKAAQRELSEFAIGLHSHMEGRR